MEHDDALLGAKQDFIQWLKINNLHSYQSALEEEGWLVTMLATQTRC
jgi:hypothetical protein